MAADIDLAKREALRLLEQQGVTKPSEIDPEQIANRLGLVVRARPLSGLDGYLLRGPRHGVIAYRETIKELGRVRFTVSHEIGHWRIHPHQNQAQLCTASDIVGYKGSDMEKEANVFASELLMPTPLVAAGLKWASPTIQKAIEIAQQFGTSLTAASLKLVESIDQPCVLVASQNNRVLWSANNPRVKHLYIERGAVVHADVPAWNCMSLPDEVGEAEKIPGCAWFSTARDCKHFEVYEQSAVLGDYDITLSYLTVYE